jgi:hypothetical protein
MARLICSAPAHPDFHKWWPESIHGCDKYGHFLQCLRAGDVDADSLVQVRLARAGLLLM